MVEVSDPLVNLLTAIFTAMGTVLVVYLPKLHVSKQDAQARIHAAGVATTAALNIASSIVDNVAADPNTTKQLIQAISDIQCKLGKV